MLTKGRDKVRLSHIKVTIKKDPHLKYRISWVKRITYPKKCGNWTTMKREKKVSHSEDPSVLTEEIHRLNRKAQRQYNLQAQSSAISLRETKLRRERRDEKLQSLRDFIDKKFWYLGDVYRDLRPMEYRTRKVNGTYKDRSKKKSFPSFVLSYLRDNGDKEMLECIYTKMENLGLPASELAAL